MSTFVCSERTLRFEIPAQTGMEMFAGKNFDDQISVSPGPLQWADRSRRNWQRTRIYRCASVFMQSIAWPRESEFSRKLSVISAKAVGCIASNIKVKRMREGQVEQGFR